MAGETSLVGRPASPGLAAGPLHVVGEARAARTPTGDPAAEREALARSIGQAIGNIGQLMATTDADGADMLAFQIALLEDDALTEGAFAAIEAGEAADRAWAEALDTEIEGYLAAEDEYFRARASDLVDVRDRVLGHLTGTATNGFPEGAIVVAEDLTPSRFLSTDWSGGGAIVLRAGSPSSHVAMLARARGVPMVVGVPAEPNGAREALIDGERGLVVLDPAPETRAAFARRLADAADEADAAAEAATRPALTADGERVAVLVNVADPAELDGLDPATTDGIGLVRTEFLFHGHAGLPDEAAQFAVYDRIAAWAEGRPVTIRTLDAGGDKPIPGLTIDGETNPFLGVRGIRLSLARPEVFKVQLRALARAAVRGNVKVMLPMVAVPAEIEAAARLLDEACAELSGEGVAHARPALGMMVEVPAAALTAARFPAAFYSIGSNDLTQYAMAASRDIGAVAHLNDAADPAVIELVRLTVEAGRATGREVSLCGDAGADLRVLPALLGAGLRAVSVAPRAVGRVKLAVAAFRAGGGA